MAFLVLMLNEKEMMKDNDFSQAVVKTSRALAHLKMLAAAPTLGENTATLARWLP
jgi:hypothetical protein